MSMPVSCSSHSRVDDCAVCNREKCSRPRNWLAIKMLFERVCGLPGSGVIPARFKEIRRVVKETIMKAFFDDVFLQRYMETRIPVMLKGLDLGAKIQNMVSKPEFDAVLKNALEDVAAKPEGAMLNMMKGRGRDRQDPSFSWCSCIDVLTDVFFRASTQHHFWSKNYSRGRMMRIQSSILHIRTTAPTIFCSPNLILSILSVNRYVRRFLRSDDSDDKACARWRGLVDDGKFGPQRDRFCAPFEAGNRPAYDRKARVIDARTSEDPDRRDDSQAFGLANRLGKRIRWTNRLGQSSLQDTIIFYRSAEFLLRTRSKKRKKTLLCVRTSSGVR